MKNLREMTAGGEIADLVPSFPCVTCPVQANMTTGCLPAEHGVIGNGFYWRERQQVEMWTSPNDCIDRPQIWDLLSRHGSCLPAAVWFPLHSKGCRADYVSTPAPIHNPDGSESLWCHTRPVELYGELRDRLGHFPLQHFWGPMANLRLTAWIIESAIYAARKWRPRFFYIYLPHLDYAAQRSGPDSGAAGDAVQDLDGSLGRLGDEFREAYAAEPLWLIAGEYRSSRSRALPIPIACYVKPGCSRSTSSRRGSNWIWRPAGPLRWSIISSPTSSSAAATRRPRRGGRSVPRPPRDCRGPGG